MDHLGKGHKRDIFFKILFPLLFSTQSSLDSRYTRYYPLNLVGVTKFHLKIGTDNDRNHHKKPCSNIKVTTVFGLIHGDLTSAIHCFLDRDAPGVALLQKVYGEAKKESSW